MAATGGWGTVLKASGTPTALSAEGATEIDVVNYVWQITDSSKRVLDPSTEVVVHDLGGLVSASDYTIDYLFGKISFSVEPSGENEGDIFIQSGNYLPMWEITNANQCSLSISRSPKDCTTYKIANSNVAVAMEATLKDVTATLSEFGYGIDDYDTGGTEVVFFDMLKGYTEFLLEIKIDAASTFRGWGFFSGQNSEAPVEDLLNSGHDWQGTTHAGSQASVSFGFSDE